MSILRLTWYILVNFNKCLSGVMVCVLALSVIDGFMVFNAIFSVIDCWLILGNVKRDTVKLIFVASPLSMQYEGVRAKTGCLRVWIKCQSGATCLSVFSELGL